MLNYFSRTKLRGLRLLFSLKYTDTKGEITFSVSLDKKPLLCGVPVSITWVEPGAEGECSGPSPPSRHFSVCSEWNLPLHISDLQSVNED